MSDNETYCFVSPFSTENTVKIICKAVFSVGKIRKADPTKGYVIADYHVGPLNNRKMEFFIKRGVEDCKVRCIFHGDVVTKAKDNWWDNFLSALFLEAPSVDFGVTLANKQPYVVGVFYLGDDTYQVHHTCSTGGTSVLGFLMGGALFGSAGAVVGGLSGKQRTVGTTSTRFSNSQLARIIYNNGRLWEGSISKGSPLYNEIMVNF